MEKIKIKSKEQNAIIESLKAGIVPKIGLHHICVGRQLETNEMIKDFDLVSAGGAKSRFIIGEYGAGKTFFLTLAKLIAHEKNLVVVSADITMDKVLCSADGKSQKLFAEFINSMSTKTKPDGGALKSLIEKWASNVLQNNENISEEEIARLLLPLDKYVNSYDFAKVISEYLKAYKDCNEIKMGEALRWLRAEYSTKTEAKNNLGVRTIIDDSNFYDYLKLFSAFIKLSGYNGLVVNIDELAILARLKSNVRNKNFERILSIVNDSLQGSSEYISFIFGGTPEFLEDKYKGLFSYGALETRLAENPFSKKGMVDLTSPVIRLENLSQEDLFILFKNIRDVFASFEEDKYLLDDEGIKLFMQWLLNRLGAEAYLTPRESIKSFVGLLSQLQNFPSTNINDYLGNITLKPAVDEDDELFNLTLGK